MNVVQADLDQPEHQADVLAMTAAYALDVMGNNGPLPADVMARVIPALRAHPTTIVFLAYDDRKAVGIATCFLGFSTFAAKPLINIHDLAVVPEYRGRGVSQVLLGAVEAKARGLGCAKLTLEVQENNLRARHVYGAAGFSQAIYGDTTGASLFYSKRL